jgi:AraC-like DNA-binding protein
MLYYPVQPYIDSPHPQPWIWKREALPDARLRPHVVCYWTLRSDLPVKDPCMMHGVPDGCIDLFMYCHDFTGSYLVGLAGGPIMVPLKGAIRYFGVRFLPGQIRRFLPFPPDYTFDTGLPLADIAGRIFEPYEERIVSAGSFAEQVCAMDDFLLRRISRDVDPRIDARILRALDRIYLERGCVPIEDLASDECMSVRHLNRLFRSGVGLNPKMLSRVVRFQNALRRMTDQPHDWLGDIALDGGYYDQSHFLNEFKLLYGKTPSFLRSR